MFDFEKLGVFYLGRKYDLQKGARAEEPLLYDSRDLLTHAVCVGMTGSGKTGLCLALLEEAAIDGIPAIAVDPKGDLGNLLLTFPELAPADFAPWISEEEARRHAVAPEEYARQQAELWRKGLADWGQDPARIRRLRDAAEFAIYTPGSSAGLPVSILRSFAAPAPEIVEDRDLLQERVGTVVTGLLGLLGVDADPLRSREHILLSTLLDTTWRKGQDLDLEQLIRAVQTPPIARVGVFDVESFFPSRDRFEFAMRINNLLAAPGQAAWIEGPPLDLDSILYTATGRPRIAIFAISHLNDAERMFFVSLLLTSILGWMRSKPGTASLRALFYMDEIAGYFPPVANPPSKGPLLTLLKQARAFGLGTVLATQNPVDLDYKGLSNAGTWFIGRLQTERDKERVLDGLEGVRTATDGLFDRSRLGQTLAALPRRVFLMHNVNEEEPILFQTRWVMSYLRGPLTRDQIRRLAREQPPPPEQAAATSAADAAAAPGAQGAAAAAAPQSAAAAAPAAQAAAPVLPPDLPARFVPARTPRPEAATLQLEPMLLGLGRVHLAHAASGAQTILAVARLARFRTPPEPIDWEAALALTLDERELEPAANDAAARFALPPPEAVAKRNYGVWSKGFADWLYRTRQLELWQNRAFGFVSKIGEPERDFRIRLSLAAHEKRDLMLDRLRAKYAAKSAALDERIRRAEQAVERERTQARQQQMQTAISLGATVLGALLGRRRVTQSTLGRAATTARTAGRAAKEAGDIDHAEENVESLRAQLAAIETEVAAETESLRAAIEAEAQALEPLAVKPRRADVSVTLVVLAWAPYWRDVAGQLAPAW